MATDENSTTGQGGAKGASRPATAPGVSPASPESSGAEQPSSRESLSGVKFRKGPATLSSRWMVFAWLAACWTPLIWRLSHLWRSETEQLFGFGVPVLVAWLLWQRRADWCGEVGSPIASGSNGSKGSEGSQWRRDLPVPVSGNTQTSERAEKGNGTGRSRLHANPFRTNVIWRRALGGTVVATGAVALLLATLALEANPLWPKAAWLAVSAALAVTLAGVFLSNGWRAARVVGPVLVLMLTALKWPAQIYEPVMHGLMQFNAVIAAELVSLSGTPAVVLGSVIEVARGMVGVDEACSGLRSLQTVVMMAFFLGEMERLRTGRRVLLLAGAVLAALVVNVARTTSLTWIFANRGAEVEERWHDPAGIAALFVTLALVWLIFEYISKTKAARVAVAASVQVPSGQNASASVASAAASAPVSSAPVSDAAPSRFAWRPLVAVLACVVTIEATTEAWYRSHEGAAIERVVWELAPAGNAGWGHVEVPRRTQEILRYESGESFARELTAPSRQLLAFAFRWEADLARNGQPELHDPLVCLPSVGAVREGELAELRVNVEGVEVPFRVIRFRQGALTQHVAFCLWGTRIGGPDTARWQGGDITAKRWDRVRAGLRDDEREQLIFFVQGETTDEGARETLRDAVLTLMRRK